jgi:hypothetical protein
MSPASVLTERLGSDIDDRFLLALSFFLLLFFAGANLPGF